MTLPTLRFGRRGGPMALVAALAVALLAATAVVAPVHAAAQSDRFEAQMSSAHLTAAQRATLKAEIAASAMLAVPATAQARPAAANGKASASSITDWNYVSGSDVTDNSGTCKGWMNKKYNADGTGPFTQGVVRTWDTYVGCYMSLWRWHSGQWSRVSGVHFVPYADNSGTHEVDQTGGYWDGAGYMTQVCVWDQGQSETDANCGNAY